MANLAGVLIFNANIQAHARKEHIKNLEPLSPQEQVEMLKQNYADNTDKFYLSLLENTPEELQNNIENVLFASVTRMRDFFAGLDKDIVTDIEKINMLNGILKTQTFLYEYILACNFKDAKLPAVVNGIEGNITYNEAEKFNTLIEYFYCKEFDLPQDKLIPYSEEYFNENNPVMFEGFDGSYMQLESVNSKKRIIINMSEETIPENELEEVNGFFEKFRLARMPFSKIVTKRPLPTYSLDEKDEYLTPLVNQYKIFKEFMDKEKPSIIRPSDDPSDPSTPSGLLS